MLREEEEEEEEERGGGEKEEVSASPCRRARCCCTLLEDAAPPPEQPVPPIHSPQLAADPARELASPAWGSASGSPPGAARGRPGHGADASIEAARRREGRAALLGPPRRRSSACARAVLQRVGGAARGGRRRLTRAADVASANAGDLGDLLRAQEPSQGQLERLTIGRRCELAVRELPGARERERVEGRTIGGTEDDEAMLADEELVESSTSEDEGEEEERETRLVERRATV